MAVEANPVFIQGDNYSAELTRRGTSGFLLARGATIGSVTGGVVNFAANDLQMSPPGSGLSVNVAVGECIVPGSSSSTQGGYYFRGSSTTNLAVATANPTNPRVDLVCATVNDAAYTGSLNTGILQVVTGTPTSGATLSNLTGAPSLPTSSLLIGYILVPANATNIISADLGDHRAQLALSLPAGAFTAGQGISIVSSTIGLLGTESVNVVGTSGTTQTLAAVATDIGNDITLSANCAITMPAAARGAFCYALMRQAVAGGFTVTFTSVKWPSGTAPTMSSTASSIDRYDFVSDGTSWYGVVAGQRFS